MKHIIIIAILATCCSCKYTQRITTINNADRSAFSRPGNAIFSDSCITIPPEEYIELSESYKNFELNFECKTGEGATGGIYFHAQKGNLDTGYELFINNNIGIEEWRKTGGLTAVRNFGKRTVNNNQWFPLCITVIGKQIRTYSNKVFVVDYIEPEDPYREEKYKHRLLSSGNIIFKCKSGDLSIRNISIRTLPEDTVNISTGGNEQTDDIIKLHQRNFPTIDHHIHVKGGLKFEEAERYARNLGVTYSVAPNCGQDFPIKNDTQLLDWLANNQKRPFLMPLQAEGREWTGMFSKDAIAHFDWVFTDALTWRDSKGRRLRLWIPEDTHIDEEQSFMEELTNVTCKILQTEAIQVFANPTYLPENLVKDYDRLWTEERMLRIINTAKENNIALEINNLNKIPSFNFIRLAKDKGIKFTFGTNNANWDQLGKMEYLIEAIDKCGLTASDMYIPESKNF